MTEPAPSTASQAPDGAVATSRKELIANELRSHPFRPVGWAKSGLLQTILASFGRGPRPGALHLQRWTLPDGDFVRLHFADRDPAAPLVLLLHGLEGSVRSGYVRAMLGHAQRAGWNFAVLEFRSCGGEANRSKRTYHSGETADFGFVVERLRAERPGRPLFVVGFSLGGNVLLKWLGECGTLVPDELVAAAAVSAPFDLEVAARQCDARYGGLIARHFLKTLIPKALAKAARFPGLLDAAAVRRCRTFAAFDDLVTAPLHGFRSAEHYWRSSSCAQFLAAVRVPTLLVGAEDDPLVPGRVLPHAAVADSPFLTGLFPARGGHCGFVTGGVPGRLRRWAEAQVARFFALQLAAAGEGATGAPCHTSTATSPPA